MRHVFHVTFYVFQVLFVYCWDGPSVEQPLNFPLVSERARWLHGFTASDYRW